MFNKLELNGIEALVLFPENYSDEEQYPVFIGLAGGGQSHAIVQFSASTYFNSEFFKDYIRIIPINTNNHNFKDYSSDDINDFIEGIRDYFNVTNSNWAIGGVSNGGKAAFNFVAQNPLLYLYVASFPGGIFENEPNNEWSHLKIVLANGKKDGDSWLLESKATYEKLLPIVSSIDIMVIAGQNHTLTATYDINQIYSKLFQNN
ncbi:hypothetical protein [Flavobacterium sp. FlaQc-28]|uniref:hypothetical protein n=1 Tax=Flavobacterium sp. FlaQc-28 TaxID=3374178 RepID=UPI0037584549